MLEHFIHKHFKEALTKQYLIQRKKKKIIKKKYPHWKDELKLRAQERYLDPI
jgi:hypothetical protein